MRGSKSRVWIDGRRGIRCAMIGTRAVHAGPGWTAARRPVRFYTAAVIVTRSAAQISVRILNPQQESRRGGTPLPLLKCLKGIMDGVANHFPVTIDCRILYIQSQKFSGVIYHRTPAEAPRCWDPDTISAWFATVPTVPVLRNVHRLAIA